MGLRNCFARIISCRIPCINISRSIPYINPETGVAENAFVTCNLDIDDLPQLAKLFNLCTRWFLKAHNKLTELTAQFNSIYGDPIAEKFSPCAGQPGNPQILACHDLPVGHNLRVDDTGLFTKDDDAPAPIRTDFAMVCFPKGFVSIVLIRRRGSRLTLPIPRGVITLYRKKIFLISLEMTIAVRIQSVFR